MNPTLRWQLMKNKAPHLLESSQAAVLSLWKELVNLLPQLLSAQHLIISCKRMKSLLSTTPPINRYRDYRSTRLTSFSECPDVVVWCDSCGRKDDPVSLMAWAMKAIPTMSSECERIFSSTGRLVPPLQNRLKEDIIEASECSSAWYKKSPAN